MTDPKQKLTSEEIAASGLEDWRRLMNVIRARFRTGDFETGLALVNRIGEAAEAANHHPDITLTYPEVIVSLSSHDVHGITSRDIDLAREISTMAAGLGAEADTAGLTQLDIGLDTAQHEQLAPFYAALLGSELDRGEPVDSSGQVPTIWWQASGEGTADSSLPAQDHEQRWHFDVWVAEDEGERRLAKVLEAGGRLVSDEQAPSFWVVEDADGNRSCICTPKGR